MPTRQAFARKRSDALGLQGYTLSFQFLTLPRRMNLGRTRKVRNGAPDSRSSPSDRKLVAFPTPQVGG